MAEGAKHLLGSRLRTGRRRSGSRSTGREASLLHGGSRAAQGATQRRSDAGKAEAHVALHTAAHGGAALAVIVFAIRVFHAASVVAALPLAQYERAARSLVVL